MEVRSVRGQMKWKTGGTVPSSAHGLSARGITEYEMRRMRLNISGHVYDPSLFDEDGGGFSVSVIRQYMLTFVCVTNAITCVVYDLISLM